MCECVRSEGGDNGRVAGVLSGREGKRLLQWSWVLYGCPVACSLAAEYNWFHQQVRPVVSHALALAWSGCGLHVSFCHTVRTPRLHSLMSLADGDRRCRGRGRSYLWRCCVSGLCFGGNVQSYGGMEGGGGGGRERERERERLTTTTPNTHLVPQVDENELCHLGLAGSCTLKDVVRDGEVELREHLSFEEGGKREGRREGGGREGEGQRGEGSN